VDGADNFPTRYLVNDASVWHDIPVVHGSIFRFEGQVTVFKPGKGAARGARHQEAWASPTAPSEMTGRYVDEDLGGERGPCYRCLFPQPPPPELAPSCAEGGVLGVLPGVIGSIQAAEALKLALGIGEPLVGRLLLYDALSGEFDEMKLRRDPACPVCGENPSITDYVDYVEFCSGPLSSPATTHAGRSPAPPTPDDADGTALSGPVHPRTVPSGAAPPASPEETGGRS
jgi:molybdopterin/thiamine biosynthesis adenylyltransferase